VRSRATAAALCLALAAGAVTAQVAHADDTDVPSRAEVAQAEEAVTTAADDVVSLQAAIAAANERLRASSVAAAQAAEAFNGARYEAALARAASRKADREEAAALADVARLRDVYASSVVTSYQSMPTLNALSGVIESDGILDVIERMDTMRDTELALDDRYDEFRIASSAAQVAGDQAGAARAEAEQKERAARDARDAAQAAADAAAAQAQAVADEKARLLTRLARLQDISVDLAQRRQAGLEAAAAKAAAEQAAAQAAAEQAQDQQEQQERDPAPQPHPPPEPPPPPPPPGAPAPAQQRPAAGVLGRPGRRGVRARPDRRALRVGRRRTGLLGLLRPDHGRLGARREVAAALLRGPVRPVHADRAEPARAGRPGLLGLVEQPLLDLPRGALHRGGADHPRPPLGAAGLGGVHVLLDSAQLLRSPLGTSPPAPWRR
jgi:hypothetical protein